MPRIPAHAPLYVRDFGSGLRTSLAPSQGWGSRLVPYVEGPKRALRRGGTLPLSCTDTSEVQVNLDGRIQPKTAPHEGG
jgi:hypothetical protein